MMKNPHAGESLRHLYRMAKAGVELHGQIVLCRGINDGRELDRTLGDLAALYPALSSVSIVPAGLTRYREGLPHLTTFSPEECRAVIAQVDAVADRLFATHGSRLFFPSDEFYLTAGYPLPDEEFYEGYPQLENGVGMITSLRTEFAAWQEAGLALRHPRPRHISLATGVAAYPLMQELATRMCTAFPHLSVNVFCIENRFFGPHITVAGLLTARDIIDQLSGQELGRELLLPAATLRHEGDLFLDGMSLHEVEKALSVRIRTVESDGEDLARALLGLRRA
jgi:putative radical SAM enzyme (TIGR03279 family)